MGYLGGRLVVDDGPHVFDVEAARGHVGRDENARATALELLHDPVTLLL